MSEIESRLVRCFQAVFPDLTETQIPKATQETVPAWDSMATITLIGVVDDEFHIQVDIDQLANLDSFERFNAYLKNATQVS